MAKRTRGFIVISGDGRGDDSETVARIGGVSSATGTSTPDGWRTLRLRLSDAGGGLTMPFCNNCGRYVSHDFVRVFGWEGEVEHCLDCARHADIHDGAAAR